MELSGSIRIGFFKFLVCHFLCWSVLQDNMSDNMTISNMLKSGADYSSCRIFCEHNALNILNKNEIYFIV